MAGTWPATRPQQQELLLTDALALLALNPLAPALHTGPPPAIAAAQAGWVGRPGGEVAITHAGEGLAFDNETPRHRALLQPFEIGHRRVTNSESQAFVDDGGYRRPALWLSDGWAMVQAQGWLVLRPLPTLARRAGWAPQTVWTDGAHRFSPHWLEPAA